MVERDLRIRRSQIGGRTEVIVPGQWDWLMVFGAIFILVQNVFIYPNMAPETAGSTWDLLLSSSPLFIFIFLLLSGVAVFLLFGSLVWSAFGSEKILITKAGIDHEIRLLGWLQGRSFESNQIKSANWIKVSRWRVSIKARLGSHIAVSLSGGEKVGIAYGTSQTEGQAILDTLTQVAGIPQK